mmetsp:Transcript_27685/g.70524  ORF Transcript_27685/g.70524 Transcript_27685/m.70524 type:complete len:205 (-) Transcript_27685:1821-2435(-)
MHWYQTWAWQGRQGAHQSATHWQLALAAAPQPLQDLPRQSATESGAGLQGAGGHPHQTSSHQAGQQLGPGAAAPAAARGRCHPRRHWPRAACRGRCHPRRRYPRAAGRGRCRPRQSATRRPPSCCHPGCGGWRPCQTSAPCGLSGRSAWWTCPSGATRPPARRRACCGPWSRPLSAASHSGGPRWRCPTWSQSARRTCPGCPRC